MNGARLPALARRFVAHALTSDLARLRAADDERAELGDATVGIGDAWAQDYLAWRRALLWVAAGGLAFACILAIAEHASFAAQLANAEAARAPAPPTHEQLRERIAAITGELGKDNLALADGLQGFLLFAKVLAAGLAAMAARAWTSVRRSRWFARGAWGTAFVLPLLVVAFPWHPHAEMPVTLRLMLAAVALTALAPKLLALAAGVLRGALALKTLLPESSVPGWVAVVCAPLLTAAWLAVWACLSHGGGGLLLTSAVVLLAAGPYAYLRRAKDLARPHSPDELAVVRNVRRLATPVPAVGFVLLVVALFRLDVLSGAAALHLLLETAALVLLTMVAAADLVLLLLGFGRRQTATFATPALREGDERRLTGLAAAGLTHVRDVPDADGIQVLGRGPNAG